MNLHHSNSLASAGSGSAFPTAADTKLASATETDADLVSFVRTELLRPVTRGSDSVFAIIKCEPATAKGDEVAPFDEMVGMSSCLPYSEQIGLTKYILGSMLRGGVKETSLENRLSICIEGVKSLGELPAIRPIANHFASGDASVELARKVTRELTDFESAQKPLYITQVSGAPLRYEIETKNQFIGTSDDHRSDALSEFSLSRAIYAVPREDFIGRLPTQVGDLVISNGTEIIVGCYAAASIDQLAGALKAEVGTCFSVDTELYDLDPEKVAIVAFHTCEDYHSIFVDTMKIEEKRISFTLASELDLLNEGTGGEFSDGNVHGFDSRVLFFACYLGHE